MHGCQEVTCTSIHNVGTADSGAERHGHGNRTSSRRLPYTSRAAVLPRHSTISGRESLSVATA